MPTLKEKMITLRPPRIAMALMVLNGLLYALAPALRLRFWSRPWWGAGACLLGVAIMLWGWSEFRRKDNPICPTATAVALIRSGPFRFSRNPMYLGVSLILLSPAMGMGSPLFLLSPLAFLAICNFVFVPYEEKRLANIFGKPFLDYLAAVRRWL